jgi:RNA polymerase sigma-70 factor (ECF subfamily)
MVPDVDDAYDLVQEVFINLYQNIERKVVIEHPRSWLYKVTINKCIDFTKKRNRYEKIELFSQLKEEDNQVDGDDKQVVVRLALSKLTKEESVLAILYSEGCSYKEIAEITGIRFSSVGKTLARTLVKLGNELKKLNYELY